MGGVEISSLRSSRRAGERSLSLAVAPFGNSMLISPGRARHRAGTCARASHQDVGPVPKAPVTDSPALRPLHSIPFHFRRLQFHSIAFRRPQTVETVKDTSGAKTGSNNSHQAGLLPGLVARWPIRHGSRRWRSSRGSNLHCVQVRADRARRQRRVQTAARLRPASHQQ